MDGLTAIRELRVAEAAGALSRNMVIALTGNARQGQIDQAMSAGMDDGKWSSMRDATDEDSCDQTLCFEYVVEED